MISMTNKAVTIGASQKHTGTVIFMHGRGDTGHGWASSLSEIKPPYVKLICPNAPTIPITLDGGLKMPAWFDIEGLTPDTKENEQSIEGSAAIVHNLINEELKGGIPAHRILIGGFSQGGALSLYASLTTPHKLAGVVALSCWLPLPSSFPNKIAPGSTETPIMMCHGDSDLRISHKWGQDSSSILKKFNESVEFRTYKDLGHTCSEEEMKDIKSFIERCLPPV